MPLTQQEQAILHFKASHHRKEIERRGYGGCFFCLAISSVDDIVIWIDHLDTAICPRCEIDSIIPFDSPASDKTILCEMQTYWFRDLFTAEGETY